MGVPFLDVLKTMLDGALGNLAYSRGLELDDNI